MKLFIVKFSFIVLLLLTCSLGNTNSILVCSAENFYGNVAEMIGGTHVEVTSIISNPDADPHLFGTSPDTAITISKAQIIIYNGANYDPCDDSITLIKAEREKTCYYQCG